MKPSETSRPTFQTDETLYEVYFWLNWFPLGKIAQCENFSGQSDANNPLKVHNWDWLTGQLANLTSTKNSHFLKRAILLKSVVKILLIV